MKNSMPVDRHPAEAAAVLISPDDFDLLTEQARFVDAVKRGLADARNGRVVPDEKLNEER